MKEKFSDFDGQDYLKSEGRFTFTIKEANVQSTKDGSGEVVKILCVAPEGQTTIYKSLSNAARWSYNILIRAALKISKEDWKEFSGDYSTIHTTLIGKTFDATVVKDEYTKTTKIAKPDGTYETVEEIKTSYKIDEVIID